MRMQVSDRKPGIRSPDINDGRAATVIGRVHPEKVALREAGLDRLYPVASVLVRRT